MAESENNYDEFKKKKKKEDIVYNFINIKF